MKIDNLIIDFGGVLYDIAPNETLALFNSYGAKQLIYSDLADMQVFKDYETGSISSLGFIRSLRDIFVIDNSISDELITAGWNKTLVGIFDNSIETLKTLKKRYNLALLSNTNELHYLHFMPHCQELFSIFDRCFFSHQINMRKPNTDIYKHVISDMGYKSCNTTFIDDSEANISGAQKAGLHTFHITPDTCLSDYLHTV